MVLGPIVYPYLEKAASDWLYGDWSESKYDLYKRVNQIPGVNQYFNYLLDKRADSEYMRHNQIDWSDIHDPRKLSQTSSYGGLVNYVSNNVSRLYPK